METKIVTPVPPEDIERAPSPPYISFTTLKNCLEWLGKEGIPLQFDRSFWGNKFSGATGPQLLAGLRFLGLLSGERPEPTLQQLTSSKADERKRILGDILRKAYDAVRFDQLQGATPKMVRDWFEAYRLDGDTKRKAISFFVNAAKDAEIPMSNGVRKMARNKPPKSTTIVVREKKKRDQANLGKLGGSGHPPGEPPPPQSDSKSWEDKLLEKFPAFDPNWPDDVKAKWFDGFDRLMGKKPSK